MKFLVINLLLLLCGACSTIGSNIHDEFVNNINGNYQLFGNNVTENMVVSPEGNIVINGLAVYNISLVLSTNSAIYQVANMSGFVPVNYTTDILYIGDTNQNTNNLDFNKTRAFGVKS